MNLILRLWAVLFPSVILRANLSGLKKPLSVILLMHGGAENISECHCIDIFSHFSDMFTQSRAT